MVEARERRGERAASKSDMSGIQTQTLKRKKTNTVKAAAVVSETQPTPIPHSRESKLGSPKRMKTMMSDDISQDDLKITTCDCTILLHIF